jgi:hypothetical protein
VLACTSPERLAELQRLARARGVERYSGVATAEALVAVWKQAIEHRVPQAAVVHG